jgi:hypothetical protein
MGWVQRASTTDFLCFEHRNKILSCRIESRKTDTGWQIYKSYVGESGINYTEEYVAPTFDKMTQIVSALQKEKTPSVTELRAKIIEKSRRITIQIEREYKEYGVEKWKFGINKAPTMNFCLVRCYDEIDMDFIVHEQYKNQETEIVKEIIDMLGFEGMEDIMNINIYYFAKHSVKVLETADKESSQIDFL